MRQGMFCCGGVRLGSQGGAWLCIVCWGELRRGMAVKAVYVTVRQVPVSRGMVRQSRLVTVQHDTSRYVMAVEVWKGRLW